MHLDLISLIDNVVFLDLKTDGFDPINSKILEIGIVKIVNNKPIICSYSLQDKEVGDIEFEVIKFIENYPIICHDIKVKLGFLKIFMPKIKNEILDSKELAVILEPYHKEYSISFLKENITNYKEDYVNNCVKLCIDNIIVVNSLLLRLNKIERSTLEPLMYKINSFLGKFNFAKWKWSIFIDNINYEEYDNENFYVKYDEDKQDVKSKRTKEHKVRKKLHEHDRKYEELLKEEDLWVSKEGFIYEFRPGQYELTKTVREVFNKVNNQAKVAIVEAPTGIGKSVGYLLPAILESYISRKRIIISTDTKELQTQLIYKDIPNVLNSLDLKNNISYGYIKGKNNYICVEKLEAYVLNIDGENLSDKDALSLIYLQRYIDGGIYGDIEEINDWIIVNFSNIKEYINNVICDTNTCRPKRCTKTCLYKQRVEELKEESITVINHSLLAKWPYKEEKPLENIIIDEAHNLVEKGYDFFSGIVDSRLLEYLLYEIYPYEFFRNSNRVYEQSNTKWKKNKMFDKFYFKIGLSRDIKDKISKNINFILEDLKNILIYGIESDYKSVSSYNLRWELNLQENEVAGIIDRDDINSAITYKSYSENIKQYLDKIIKNLVSIILLIENQIDDDNIDKEDEIFKQCKSRLKEIEEIKDLLKIFLEYNENDNFARIVDIDKNFDFFEVKVVPLNLADLFEENILSNVNSAVFLSATLSIQNSMNYFKNSLGLNRVENVEKIISPLYDYKNRVKVISTNDVCIYKSDNFIKEIGDFIVDLSQITKGSMLSLYNSNERLEKSYINVKDKLYNKNIETYLNKQGIKYLKDLNNNSIVMGSKGCFEGVDIPGDGLICVTLDKIPNLNPKDPLYSTIMKKHNITYTSLNYPQMAIKVKQAMGRILRSKYDYGCFIVFNTGSNINTIKKLEHDLHDCSINLSGCNDAKLSIKSHFKKCREGVLSDSIRDTIKNYKLINCNDRLDKYINDKMQERGLNIKIYDYNEKNKTFKVRYFDLNYLINIEKI